MTPRVELGFRVTPREDLIEVFECVGRAALNMVEVLKILHRDATFDEIGRSREFQQQLTEVTLADIEVWNTMNRLHESMK